MIPLQKNCHNCVVLAAWGKSRRGRFSARTNVPAPKHGNIHSVLPTSQINSIPQELD